MTDFLERLRFRLQQPLPGTSAQKHLEPAQAYGRHRGPLAPDARTAAVAVVLFEDEQGVWHFPLTERPGHMKDHPGQICLPGGVRECRESAEFCAKRELDEELGIPAESMAFVGNLTPLYVFGTNYYIEPVVLAGGRLAEFRPNPAEVARVLQLSIGQFLQMAPPKSVRMERDGMEFEAPAWEVEGACLWGATAMVLAEWKQVLCELDRESD